MKFFKDMNAIHRLFRGQRPELWICLFLTAAILVIYWPVGGYDFINLDDPLYVTDNAHVREGLTFDGLKWAFSGATEFTNYWAPLTWLSFMLDYELYGMNAGGYHVTNLIWHIANTLLLFFTLWRITGAMGRSGIVAALFAVHPLHVESVAWVTERKDVLSAFFWMLTLLCYGWYVKRESVWRYILVLLSFILGLMAKPMLVTLPFVLLLLDRWPFARFRVADLGAPEIHQKSCFALIVEKVPFLAIAAALSVATFITQRQGGAIAPLEALSISVRLENMIVSYASYLYKMIWPLDLAVLYPHPGGVPFFKVLVSGLLLIVMSLTAWIGARSYPWIAVGWLWYLGTLFPVSGLVVIGPHAMADRYTYIPLIGIFITLVWASHEALHRWRHGSWGSLLAGIPVLAVLMLFTWNQVKYWENSISLFSHTLEVTDANWLIHNNLGNSYAEINQTDRAINHYQEAIRIKPNYAEAYNNIGTIMAKMNRQNEAAAYFTDALKYDSEFAFAHNNLGRLRAEQKEYQKAIRHFKEALRIKPDYQGAKHNLQVVLKFQAADK